MLYSRPPLPTTVSNMSKRKADDDNSAAPKTKIAKGFTPKQVGNYLASLGLDDPAKKFNEEEVSDHEQHEGL